MKSKQKTFLILTMALLLLSSVYVNAAAVQLEVRFEDPTYGQNNPQRGPVLIPEVSIEGYTLFFDTPCDGCLLRIVNEDDDVEYSTIIPIGTTSLVLPSYLSGDYELQIISGEYIFYGDITL